MANLFQNFFYQPVLNLLVFLYNIIPGHDLGVTIIIFTIIIKLLLLPLSKKSIKSQKILQDLQPQIDELKKKYGDKKDEMGRKMMELYKENKVNPFSSCLPLLLQFPFLIAIFRVFSAGFDKISPDQIYYFISTPATYNTISFGILDLTKPSIVLAVLAGLAQFWQAKMLTTKRPPLKVNEAKDENMMAIMNKQMLYIMPAMTVFIGISFSGGLTLYWLATTLLTILQQFYLFKKDKPAENLIKQ